MAQSAANWNNTQHSRASHAFTHSLTSTQSSYNHVVRSASSAIRELGIEFLFWRYLKLEACGETLCIHAEFPGSRLESVLRGHLNYYGAACSLAVQTTSHHRPTEPASVIGWTVSAVLIGRLFQLPSRPVCLSVNNYNEGLDERNYSQKSDVKKKKKVLSLVYRKCSQNVRIILECVWRLSALYGGLNQKRQLQLALWACTFCVEVFLCSLYKF